MQPPNLAPTLTLSQRAALIEALTKGGMPELFFSTVERVVTSIIADAIERDRKCRQDIFGRGAR